MRQSVRATRDACISLPAGHVADRSADLAVGAATAHATESDTRAVVAQTSNLTVDTATLLTEIVERASTPRERLTSMFIPSPAASPARVAELMDSWCRSAAKGDATSFDHRLALDGLDRASAERALGPVRLCAGCALPEWALLLGRYIDFLRDGDAPPPGGDGEAQCRNGVPFAEVLTTLAALADRELERRAGAALEQLSPGARAGLRASLVHRLVRVAAPLLYGEFDRQRAAHSATRLATPERARSASHPSAPPLPNSPSVQSRQVYRDYVARMLDGGMVQLLREYPVLARLMATTALFWRASTAELLARLEEDRDAIAACFADGRALGKLVAVHGGLSDSHGGGRTVHSLEFACGLRLVYKPRSLGIDAAFDELLRWLGARGAPLPAAQCPRMAARVLDRHDHGWAEHVEHRECQDLSAVRRYYQYSGALLALLHTLGSTDCHYENIIAAGERPVVIDLETVLQPALERAEPPVDRARNIGARTLYDDSVLRTGMLPAWQSSGNDVAYDVGGLSASAGQATPFTALRWTRINTDAMRLEQGRAVLGRHPNMPLLGGSAVPPADHVGDIVLGFSRMYEWLAAHAGLLLASDGPVARLARERVRFIVRPSSVYDHVLRHSLLSDALRDGAARSIELELLARGLLPLSPALWPVMHDERLALEQLDIPIFTVRGDAKRLVLDAHGGASEAGDASDGMRVNRERGESRAPDTSHIDLARSGLDVARSRFASLGAEDLARQLHVIRASFALRYTDVQESPVEECGAPAPLVGVDDAGCLSRDELLTTALEIAREVRRMAIHDRSGDVTWITVEPISTSGCGRLRATGYGLYDGLAGIATFLAAAARCGGDPQVAALARRALQPLRERLHGIRPTYVEEYGIGGADGAASAVYALLRSGILLDDETIVDDAAHAARQITPAAIARDASFDVLYGAAGAILALLALHRARPDASLLERAHRCGHHLLARRSPASDADGTTYRLWRTVGGRVLPGFAHGVAGIACALLRLHAATSDTEFREAALDAVRYEDALLDRERGDRRDHESSAVAPHAFDDAGSWCRGAAGLGLARLGALDVCHAPELRVGLERAMARTAACDLASAVPQDNICCGELGAIELLLAMGIRWGDPALLRLAHARASTVVRNRRATGHFRLLTSPAARVYDPALYRGTAGIGYGLLRLCHPEMLPSLLLWE